MNDDKCLDTLERILMPLEVEGVKAIHYARYQTVLDTKLLGIVPELCKSCPKVVNVNSDYFCNNYTFLNSALMALMTGDHKLYSGDKW